MKNFHQKWRKNLNESSLSYRKDFFQFFHTPVNFFRVFSPGEKKEKENNSKYDLFQFEIYHSSRVFHKWWRRRRTSFSVNTGKSIVSVLGIYS
jgi:hypothetical protein